MPVTVRRPRPRPQKFKPFTLKDGKPCGQCKRLGKLCWQHVDLDQSESAMRETAAAQHARGLAKNGAKLPTPKGVWEEPYFEALRAGHTKSSAAGIADVAARTVYSRAERDPEFAQQEEIAYNAGTAVMMEIAFARITDRKNPGDRVLTHLLACRGVNPKQVHEVTGRDGGPIDIQHSVVPVERLSPRLQRAILKEMEEIAAEEATSARQLAAVNE